MPIVLNGLTSQAVEGVSMLFYSSPIEKAVVATTRPVFCICCELRVIDWDRSRLLNHRGSFLSRQAKGKQDQNGHKRKINVIE
jgi:hypothetical protein